MFSDFFSVTSRSRSSNKVLNLIILTFPLVKVSPLDCNSIGNRLCSYRRKIIIIIERGKVITNTITEKIVSKHLLIIDENKRVITSKKSIITTIRLIK